MGIEASMKKETCVGRVLGWDRQAERGLVWRDRQGLDHVAHYSGSPSGLWIF